MFGIIPNMVVRYGALSKNLTEDRLRSLYTKDLRTDLEIGELIASELGFEEPFHERAVARLRKRWGIETLTARQRREHLEGRSSPSLDDLTPAALRDLYSQMGERQIAKHYGVSKPAIQRLRRLWGIEAISKTERSTSVLSLTDEQKEVIIGCMLGDGHLLERGVFKVSHAYHQYEYLKRVREILHPLSGPMAYEEKTMKGSGEVRAAFGFRTSQHVWLKAMRKMFYPEGKRVFPAPLLDSLSERSLAFWYFDDGTLYDGNLPAFALGDVDEATVENTIRALGGRFGFDTYLSPRSTPTCQIVSLRSASAGRLFEIVAPYATADMLHKIPERYWPKGVRREPKIQTSEHTSLPKDLRERALSWEPEDDDLVEDLFRFWRKAGFPFHVARPEDLSTLTRIELDHVLQKDILKARQVGQSSCQAFMPHIWSARNAGHGRSPKELFEDDDALRLSVKRALKSGKVPNAAGMRHALRYKLSGVYNFRPSVAKVLVDRYCPQGGTVYDPCGGWGGRLLGTLTSSARARYVACEPSTQSFRGLRELAQWVDRYIPGAADRVEVNCVPAEEFEPPAGVDMILTSPPYWKQEHYADEYTQSSARYGTYEEWIEKFWSVVVRRSVRSLAPGGWLVLNVDDFVYRGVRYNLVEDTVAICVDLGLGQPDRIRYAMPSPVKTDNHEWVLAWCRRGSLGNTQEPGPPLEVQTHVPAKPSREIVKECEECDAKFYSTRKDAKFCSQLCGSRNRRRRGKKPRKEHRVFTCQNEACGKTFEVPLSGGRPKLCPVCRVEEMEADELRRRTKICAYRHCGRDFVDYSRQNSAKFCHEEHRRREKLLRQGAVASVEGFRKPDPVLD